MILRPPRSTLFPCTTRFRSRPCPHPQHCGLGTQQGRGPCSRRNGDSSSGLPQLPHSALCWLDQTRSEEHTSELQSRQYIVCRLLLEKKTTITLLNMSHV